jgi:hypothetical protein
VEEQVLKARDEARAAVERHPRYSAALRSVALDLIEDCARRGYRVRFQPCSGAFACEHCEESSFEGSSVCRACRTVWVAPQPLREKSATPAEVVAVLAHELGHVIDEPRKVEPERGTPAWHVRRVEREETAWQIAEVDLLRKHTDAWRELEETVRAVSEHRLARYREERDRALRVANSG